MNPIYLTKDLLLPDETWQDIPGFEDYYQASNLGRIRSLDRWVNHKSGKPILAKGKILSQSKRFDKNILTGEPTVALRVCLMKEGKRFDLTVRRLVYLTFHRKPEQHEVVINIDGDGFNNQAENLKAVSHSQKGKRVYERNRATPTLSYLNRATFKKTWGGYSRRKAILQKDRKGTLINRYESVRQASQMTGIGEKEIIMVAKERWKQYKGFVFSYEKQIKT